MGTLTDLHSFQLGDTLLSLLAIRGGEMVDFIFPRSIPKARL